MLLGRGPAERRGAGRRPGRRSRDGGAAAGANTEAAGPGAPGRGGGLDGGLPTCWLSDISERLVDIRLVDFRTFSVVHYYLELYLKFWRILFS